MSEDRSETSVAGRLVVLHDGECSFCTSWVMRLAHWDRHDRLRFLPLGSTRGRALASRHPGLAPDHPDSVIAALGFEEASESITMRSAAAFRIVRALGWPFKLALIFRILPSALLDAFYDFIARNRKKLPGADVCVLNDPELKRRLLS